MVERVARRVRRIGGSRSVVVAAVQAWVKNSCSSIGAWSETDTTIGAVGASTP